MGKIRRVPGAPRRSAASEAPFPGLEQVTGVCVHLHPGGFVVDSCCAGWCEYASSEARTFPQNKPIRPSQSLALSLPSLWNVVIHPCGKVSLSPSLEETGSHFLARTSHMHQLQVSYRRSFNPEAGNSWKTLSERKLLLLSDRRHSSRRLTSKALMFTRKRCCELHQVVWTDWRADSFDLSDHFFLEVWSFNVSDQSRMRQKTP